MVVDADESYNEGSLTGRGRRLEDVVELLITNVRSNCQSISAQLGYTNEVGLKVLTINILATVQFILCPKSEKMIRLVKALA